MPGKTTCHGCGVQEKTGHSFIPRMKPGYTGIGASGNQWLFYCRRCSRKFHETVVPRWEKDFYCSHCNQRWTGEVYVEHVKGCLAAEMKVKKEMQSESLKTIARMVLTTDAS